MRALVLFGAAVGFGAASLVPATAQVQTQIASQSAQPAKSAAGMNMGPHDSKAPINVSANQFEGDFETKVGTYTGNVVVTQTDYKLRADKVNVNIVNGQPNKIFAHGNVVFATPSGTATGDEGVYDLSPPRTVTLTGRVVLVKEKNVMRGNLLVINVDSGVAHLTSKGRVESTLYPGQKTGSGTKKPATDGSASQVN